MANKEVKRQVYMAVFGGGVTEPNTQRLDSPFDKSLDLIQELISERNQLKSELKAVRDANNVTRREILLDAMHYGNMSEKLLKAEYVKQFGNLRKVDRGYMLQCLLASL